MICMVKSPPRHHTSTPWVRHSWHRYLFLMGILMVGIVTFTVPVAASGTAPQQVHLDQGEANNTTTPQKTLPEEKHAEQLKEQKETAVSANIDFFSPQGNVKRVRQVTARFSEPMVAFGDPREVNPFSIDCPESGKGRWVDDRNWVFDFDQDLPAGVRCLFNLKPALHTLAGIGMTGNMSFAFSTGGPTVMATLPWTGDIIDEEQIFILGLDAPVDKTTLPENIFCDISGVGERIDVRLLEGKERHEVLYAHKTFVGRYTPMMEENSLDKSQFLAMTDKEDSPIVVAQCKRRFPNNVRVGLVWGRGIRSMHGVKTVKHRQLNFRVRENFMAHFFCTRANQNAGCMPVLPINLSFTAPIALRDAQKIVLERADGQIIQSTMDSTKEQSWISDITFLGPFTEESTYTIKIPANLRDDAGRALANKNHFPLDVKTGQTPPLAKFPASFGIIEAKGDATLPVTLRNLESVLPLDAANPGSAATEEAEEKTRGKSTSAITTWWETFENQTWPKPTEVRGHRLRVKDPVTFITWMERVRDVQWGKSGWKDGDYGYIQRPGENSVFDEQEISTLETFTLPKPGGGKTFEVLGIPFQKPGLYVVELASDRLGAALHGERKPYYVQTAVLVTNLSVHFKHGRESSLVWVTTLDQGKPVAEAKVTVGNCQGERFFEGYTDKQGRLFIPKKLPSPTPSHTCFNSFGYKDVYLVTARQGEDETFLLSSWDKGIRPHHFRLPYGFSDSPLRLISTVFDRTLLRAGETVSMKHFIRQAAGAGVVLSDPNTLPQKVVIRHTGNGQTFKLPLVWDTNHTAESLWNIPKDAKSGNYMVILDEKISGHFRVDSFRIPTMKVSLNPIQSEVIHATQVSLDIQVNYLSGGGASHAPVKLRGLIQPKAMHFADYDGFVFANGSIKKSKKKHTNPWDYDDNAWGDDWNDDAPPKVTPLPVQALTLDAAGAARATIKGVTLSETPQDLLAELEYQDANGERLASSTHITLLPAQVLLGLKPDGWASSKEQIKLQALALNPQGQPMAGIPVTVELLERKTFSHRKRLIGGFYAYEHHNEVKRLSEFCSGTTDNKGLLFCEGKSPVHGNIILQGRATDTQGRASVANTSIWVAEKGEWWFDVDHHDRMDLLPEKKRYEPGEDAILQVRMPFREATVLVTVEREGILESFVQTLTGDAPILRIPMRNHYAPNVFISALAIRGRSTEIGPTALVDLGRPAYRLGYAQLKVGWKGHELAVKVKTDQPVYKVRGQAIATVKVTPAAGQPLPANAEVALAAVDEGLLALKANDSWNLLSSMMQQRPLEIETSTAQEQVIGRRHYGRKAVTHGGGGGRKKAGRQLLETLLLWQGRVKLDPQGQAQVTIPLNDALSSFRVVAVAHAGTNLFGMGTSSFRTTQDLMLYSGLPPRVREKDAYRAGFTVRNSSKHPLHTTLTASVTIQPRPGTETRQNAAKTNTMSSPQACERAELHTHPIARENMPKTTDGLLVSTCLESPPLPYSPIIVELAPGESREVHWDTIVPMDIQGLTWTVSATSKETEDRLTVKQDVITAIPVQIFQATLRQLDKRMDLPIKIPNDARPGRGGIWLQLQDQLVGDLSGVRAYISNYPYTCLEQRISKAVALQDQSAWHKIMASLPTYLDGDGLVKYFPNLQKGSDTLTAYLLSISDETEWAIPDKDLRKTMMTGLLRFVRGKIFRNSSLPAADFNLRKLSALEALSRYDNTLSPEWFSSISIEPNLWPTSAVIDWLNLLNRLKHLPNRDQRREEATQILRSRLNFQGTTLGFSTERSDYLWWLMISTDSNANRLILSLLEDEKWREDIPRLVRGSLGRQIKGHWSTTVANAWGVMAMKKFSDTFNTTPVAGETIGRLATTEQHHNWSTKPKGGTLKMPWPRGKSRLSLEHQGLGKPWVTIQSRAAIPLKKPFSSGYQIHRTIIPIEQKMAGVWSRGDVLRVHLEVKAPSDMTWVVIDDPIPAGSAILGTGLGKDSALMTQGEERQRWINPTFEERTFDAFRAYYAWVPKGRWTLEYTLRLNTPGNFTLPSTRVEAMYAPEMFGEVPLDTMTVVP